MSQHPKAHPTKSRSPSLRGDFAWTLAGNAVYAAGQWATLSLFAKLAGDEALGEYALALAVTQPVLMLAHMNLRSVLATDVERAHPLGDYLLVRVLASAASLLAVALLAVALLGQMQGGGWREAGILLAVAVGQSAEALSDLFYGALQRRERLDVVARSMIGRTVISVGALGLVLWATRDTLLAVSALALGRAAMLMGYDQRWGRQTESLARSGGTVAWKLFRTALPLGFVLMLISLNTNLPRYAVESTLGASALGNFAAVVSFITVGATMVNALGQSATSRLARLYAGGDGRGFRRATLRMAAFVLALGVAGVLVALALGAWVLELLYRPEYAAQQPLLVAVMSAGVLSYLAVFLGYAVTASRVFGAQMPLFGASAVVCAGASWVLVPRMGLEGGVAAIALSAVVQIAGQLLLLRRAWRGRATQAAMEGGAH